MSWKAFNHIVIIIIIIIIINIIIILSPPLGWYCSKLQSGGAGAVYACL